METRNPENSVWHCEKYGYPTRADLVQSYIAKQLCAIDDQVFKDSLTGFRASQTREWHMRIWCFFVRMGTCNFYQSQLGGIAKLPYD